MDSDCSYFNLPNDWTLFEFWFILLFFRLNKVTVLIYGFKSFGCDLYNGFNWICHIYLCSDYLRDGFIVFSFAKVYWKLNTCWECGKSGYIFTDCFVIFGFICGKDSFKYKFETEGYVRWNLMEKTLSRILHSEVAFLKASFWK